MDLAYDGGGALVKLSKDGEGGVKAEEVYRGKDQSVILACSCKGKVKQIASMNRWSAG
jgi:hypothetical protein